LTDAITSVSIAVSIDSEVIELTRRAMLSNQAWLYATAPSIFAMTPA
jgi:hypothetical protein